MKMGQGSPEKYDYTVSTLVFYRTEIACRQKHVFSACPKGFSGQKG